MCSTKLNNMYNVSNHLNQVPVALSPNLCNMILSQQCFHEYLLDNCFLTIIYKQHFNDNELFKLQACKM